MKEKQLIKVVCTVITGTGASRLDSKTAKGILALKKGETAVTTIAQLLAERGLANFTLHQRAESTWATSPMMFLDVDPKFSVAFTFNQFPLSEIGYWSKDLSPKEQARDFKTLKLDPVKKVNGKVNLATQSKVIE